MSHNHHLHLMSSPLYQTFGLAWEYSLVMTKVHFCKENTIKLVNAFVFFTGILTICCTIRLSQLMRQKDFPVAAQPSFNNMMKLSVPLHTQIRCHTFPYTTYSNLAGFADSVQNLTNAGTPRSRDVL